MSILGSKPTDNLVVTSGPTQNTSQFPTAWLNKARSIAAAGLLFYFSQSAAGQGDGAELTISCRIIDFSVGSEAIRDPVFISH